MDITVNFEPNELCRYYETNRSQIIEEFCELMNQQFFASFLTRGRIDTDDCVRKVTNEYLDNHPILEKALSATIVDQIKTAEGL